MTRDTIRHAKWRGKRANVWIVLLGNQVIPSDTTTLYYHTNSAGMAIKRCKF